MKRTRGIHAATESQDQAEEANRIVVLLGDGTLLGSAIEILLAPKTNWKVIRLSTDVAPGSLIRKIEQIAPHAVIVFQHERIGGTPFLINLLENCPDLKVITVSLENNSIQIYNNQRVWVKGAADLLSAVEL
jgi:hypothetical protein